MFSNQSIHLLNNQKQKTPLRMQTKNPTLNKSISFLNFVYNLFYHFINRQWLCQCVPILHIALITNTIQKQPVHYIKNGASHFEKLHYNFVKNLIDK